MKDLFLNFNWHYMGWIWHTPMRWSFIDGTIVFKFANKELAYVHKQQT